MALARTQAERPMEIATPLGDDKLMILEMNGTETLGRLYSFELELMAESAVNYADILGKNVSIRVTMRDGSSRYFNGEIARFMFLSIENDVQQDKQLYYYRATMVPRLWFLTRHSDCRIFQNMSVPDIIRKVFADRGITDFKDQGLSGTYNPWVYCVQYRETDFNFISRLMETEGIYYYFEHTNGSNSVVLCDSPNAHKAAPGYGDLDFDEPDLKSTTDAFIWNWTIGTEITPNKYALTDYNHLKPRTSLDGNIDVDHSHDPDTYEIFDYPGDYEEADESRRYANTRLEEIEAQYIIAHGTSSARGLFAGCTFNLKKHPAYDEEYLVTSITYSMENDDIGGGSGSTGGSAFTLQVTCIPLKYEFRSQRLTPRPVVQGPQTAVVVGPAGEEIHTNDQGQVKVKFFWDRNEKKDETSSCWVRVSQSWAGLNWGMINLPRIGQEVIVDFLEGDPDKPIITGRVYNAVNLPPYKLPDNQTMTTFKSNSSKGGAGFNELRFEDKKGEEQIFIHGEKNMDIRIKNDRFENILHDRHLVVENDKFEHVKNKRHEIVDVDHMEEIKGDRNLKVDGKEAKEVDGSQSLKVKLAVTEEFNDAHSEVVTKDYFLQADNIVIEGKTSITIKVGKNSISIDSSGIEIDCQEPMATFDLKTKGNTTVASDMDAGITAKMNCDLKGTAGASLEGTGQVAVKTTGMGKVTATGMLQVTSSAILQIQGSMVMIN